MPNPIILDFTHIHLMLFMVVLLIADRKLHIRSPSLSLVTQSTTPSPSPLHFYRLLSLY